MHGKSEPIGLSCSTIYVLQSPGVKLGQLSYPFNMSLPLYALSIALVALFVRQLSKVGRRPAGYPPGPPTLPLIGNLHLMPKEKAHLQFQKWAEEYGPVYSLILGTKVMIVLSSDQAVKDLLDKRSGIYSSRPDLYIGKIASGSLRMLLMVSRVLAQVEPLILALLKFAGIW
jgi:hypothetical protein